jgi:hypothetical protein
MPVVLGLIPSRKRKEEKGRKEGKKEVRWVTHG